MKAPEFKSYSRRLVSWKEATESEFDDPLKKASLRDLVRSMKKPGPILLVYGEGAAFVFVALGKDESVQSAVKRAVEVMEKVDKCVKRS